MNNNSEKSQPEVFYKNTQPKSSILVIDDNADTLYLQKIVLEMDGFEVFTAQSGAEALTVLSQIEAPHLILLDMQLEQMTGTEFLTQLEQERPEIVQKVPVVFLSGMHEIPKSKAVGFIRKPTDMATLRKAVHDFIEMGVNSPTRH